VYANGPRTLAELKSTIQEMHTRHCGAVGAVSVYAAVGAT
jgi:hypothetical protein